MGAWYFTHIISWPPDNHYEIGFYRHCSHSTEEKSWYQIPQSGTTCALEELRQGLGPSFGISGEGRAQRTGGAILRHHFEIYQQTKRSVLNKRVRLDQVCGNQRHSLGLFGRPYRGHYSWESKQVENGLCSLPIVSKVPTWGLENLDSFSKYFLTLFYGPGTVLGICSLPVN